MIYLVSRHSGAVDWCQEQGMLADAVIPHLNPTAIVAGDVVIGTLPIQLAASVQERGARYLHLSVPIPAELRGQELSAKQLTALGASLQEFRVQAI